MILAARISRDKKVESPADMHACAVGKVAIDKGSIIGRGKGKQN